MLSAFFARGGEHVFFRNCDTFLLTFHYNPGILLWFIFTKIDSLIMFIKTMHLNINKEHN